MPRLPFDSDRTDRTPKIYDSRDWRETPVIKVPRSIDPLLDEIALLTANELGRQAEENCIRIFHYNMMSDKSFRNDDFERLIRFICDTVEFRHVVERTRRIDDGLEDTIENCVYLHACNQANEYGELMDDAKEEMRRDELRAVAANVKKYHDLCRQLEEFHEEEEEPPRARARERDRDRGRDDYADRDRRGTRFDDDRGRGRERSSSRERDDYRGSRRPARVLTGREMNTEEGNVNEDFTLDPNFTPPVKNPYQRDRSESALPRSQHFIKTEMQDFDFGTTAPQEASPPAPPPISHSKPTPPPPPPIEASIQGDKFVGPFGSHPLTTFVKDPANMDIEQHSAAYGDLNSLEKATAMFTEIQRVMTLEQAVSDPTVTSDQLQESSSVTDNIRLFSSVQTMVEGLSDEAVQTTIEESGENTNGVRKLYHFFAVVDNSMVGFRHLNDIRVRLRESTDMRAILGSLNSVVKAVSEHAPVSAAFATDIYAAVDNIDRIITREINLFCRHVIKISDGNVIDSAREDYSALMDHLKGMERQDHYNAMLAFISKLTGCIRDCFNPSLDFERITAEGCELGENFGMSWLPMSYHVTAIPFTARELGIQTNVSSVTVCEDVSPFIYAALDTSNVADDSFGNPFRLIITRGLGVFRVYDYPGKRGAKVLVPIELY